MKRFLAVLLSLLLLCGAAAAETVTVPVWQEDDFTTVDVEMERLEMPVGASLAYDPAHFAPDATDPNTLRFTEVETAFLTFQSSDELSPSKLAEGLALQSHTDDCAVNESVVGGLFSDAIPATSVMYSETVEGAQYQHAFFLIPRDSDTLMIEYYHPLEIELAVDNEFNAILQTIEVSGIGEFASSAAKPTAKPSAQTGDDMVQCEICGGWFKAGNEFRNHICVEYPSADDDMVQCEICGGWFKAGNEFRNHICVQYPAADDGMTETYPSEDNMTETYPSEDNVTETYPSEDNVTYPAE